MEQMLTGVVSSLIFFGILGIINYARDNRREKEAVIFLDNLYSKISKERLDELVEEYGEYSIDILVEDKKYEELIILSDFLRNEKNK
jgi:hypothetical protein